MILIVFDITAIRTNAKVDEPLQRASWKHWCAAVDAAGASIAPIAGLGCCGCSSGSGGLFGEGLVSGRGGDGGDHGEAGNGAAVDGDGGGDRVLVLEARVLEPDARDAVGARGEERVLAGGADVLRRREHGVGPEAHRVDGRGVAHVHERERGGDGARGRHGDLLEPELHEHVRRADRREEAPVGAHAEVRDRAAHAALEPQPRRRVLRALVVHRQPLPGHHKRRPPRIFALVAQYNIFN